MLPTPATSDWSNNLILMACRERFNATGKSHRLKIIAQRFRPQFFHRRQIQSHPSKISRVFVNETFPAQIQYHRRMFRKLFIFVGQKHPARHAEMTEQLHRFAGGPGAEFEQEIFSAPRQDPGMLHRSEFFEIAGAKSAAKLFRDAPPRCGSFSRAATDANGAPGLRLPGVRA